LEGPGVSIFRIEEAEDGGSRRNVGKYLPDYTASHPKRQYLHVVTAMRILNLILREQTLWSNE
jgi:hypothetical protein